MTNLTWTPEMHEALIRMRERGVPFYLCAEKIGVSYGSALQKGRELGLAARKNRGRISGSRRMSGIPA